MSSYTLQYWRLKNYRKLKEAWPGVLHHMIFFFNGNWFIFNSITFSFQQDKYWQVLIQYCIENDGYCGCDIPELHPQDVSTNQMQDTWKREYCWCGICTRPPRRMCWSIECKTLKTVVIKWKFNCWFHVWIDYIYILENVRLICYRFFLWFSCFSEQLSRD